MQSQLVEWPLVCRGCGERGTVKMEGHDVVGTTGSFFLKSMPDTAARSSITCAACGQRHPPPPQ